MRLNEPLSYKEVCAEMNDVLKTGGKNRKLQLEKWQQDYDIEKVGMKYIIKRKYRKEEIIESKINKLSNQLKFFDYYEGKYEDRNRPVVYKIILDDKIYIGQTSNLYKRIRTHHNTKGSQGGKLLRNGGKMYVVKFTETMKKTEINKLEVSLIKQYQSDENWFCVNKCGNPSYSYSFKTKKIYNIKIKSDYVEEIKEYMKNKGIPYEIK